MSRIVKKWAGALSALLFWIFIWLCASLYVGRELIIPTPMAVAVALRALAADAVFWVTAGATLLRIFAGYALGVITGCVFAVLTTRFALVDTLLSPAVRTIRATPVASFIILALLWIAKPFVPAVMAMLMVTPVVWQSICTAIHETDAGLLELAASYRFSKLRTVRLIYIPSIAPSLLSACVTSMGLAWKSGVAAEVLCLPQYSVGTQLYYSKIYLETPHLFAWTIVVIILSLALEKGIAALAKRRRRRSSV